MTGVIARGEGFAQNSSKASKRTGSCTVSLLGRFGSVGYSLCSERFDRFQTAGSFNTELPQQIRSLRFLDGVCQHSQGTPLTEHTSAHKDITYIKKFGFGNYSSRQVTITIM